MKQRTLVTGANGYIGRALVAELKKNPNLEVLALGRQHIDFRDNVHYNNCVHYFPARYIIHCAGTTHNYHMLDDPLIDVETNVIGLIRFLELNRKYNPDVRFINLSTFFAEEANGLYGASKMCAENVCDVYRKVYDLNTMTLRLPNVYGPGEQGSKQKGSLNWMISEIVKGNDIDVYGLEFKRQFLYIGDLVAKVIYALRDHINGVVPIRAQISTIQQFLGLAIAIADSSSCFNYIDTPDFHRRVGIRDYTVGASNAKPDDIDLAEGIRRTIDYYKL